MESAFKSLKNIHESLKEKIENGEITIREAALALHEAGWTNFIDIEKTKKLLKIQQPDKVHNNNKKV